MADESFKNLENWYKSIQAAEPNSDGTYTVEGRRVSAQYYKELKKSSKKIYDDAVKDVKDAEKKKQASKVKADEAKAKAAKIAEDKVTAERKAQSDVSSRVEKLQKQNQVDALLVAGKKVPKELQGIKAGMNLSGDPAARIQARNAEIKKLIPGGERTGVPSAAEAGPRVVQPTVSSVAGSAQPVGPTGPGFRATEGFTPGPTGATGATGPTVTRGATGPTVTSGKTTTGATTVTGGKTTTGGKTSTGATVVVDGKKVKVGGDKWKEIIQEEFGSLWDIYNDNADVKKVIDKSVAEGWFNDTTKLNATLQNTNWYRATQSSVRAYTIQKSTDPATLEATVNETVASLRANTLASGVVLSDTTLRTLAENQLKYKWSEQQTANAIGSETVATARRGGPQAVADLRKGAVGTGLRAIADNYAQKPTDTMLDMWVAEVMQGTKTQEQFTDLMKTQASTQYRSLAPLIEKGQDVKTAVSMYTNAAQNVLGVDPNTVDWSQDKWNKALNYQDPKTSEYRQMDSWEWNRYLRSLPEWQETDDAKRTYRSAAFTLAQAFGKTS
jgi:hypothetical protein